LLLKIKIILNFYFIGDWGLGIGDWGLGIGPNPQSPLIFLYNIILSKLNSYNYSIK